MITVKYKVSELAKDFNKSAKDIIALLAEKFEEPKKNATNLTVEELDYVFEKLTRKTEVENFDEYFKMGESARKKAQESVQKEKRLIRRDHPWN